MNIQYFIYIILDDNGKENNYWDFNCILKYAIGDTNMIEESNYIILWDNASIHRSNLALKTAKNLNLNIHFLPSYSPFLAPVELFFKILKSKVRKLMMQREINFNWQKEQIFLLLLLITIQFELSKHRLNLSIMQSKLLSDYDTIDCFFYYLWRCFYMSKTWNFISNRFSLLSINWKVCPRKIGF